LESLLAAVFVVGAAGGFLSGLLGVGGAVVLLPLLTTFVGLTTKQASGITIAQVTAASLISLYGYRRSGLVHLPLALYMGAGSALGGIAGGYGSRAVPNAALDWIFLVVVLAAIALLFVRVGDAPRWDSGRPHVNPLQSIGLGMVAGTLAGLLGAGGGFLLVPLMIGTLRLPTRLAIGTSPAVILIAGSAGLVSKVAAGQVPANLAAALVLGAMPTAYLGGWVNRRLPPRTLRLLLGGILSLVATRGVLAMLASR
jgi:uncharacterized membrane protein YfcA